MDAVLLFAVASMSAVLSHVGAVSIPNGMGPFRIELRNVVQCAASENCLRPDKMSVGNLKIAKDRNKEFKYIYNADVNSTIEFDDSYKADVRVSRWSSLANSWTSNVFKLTLTNPCSLFKSHRPDIFKQISDLYYGGTLTDCPIHPVNAAVRNFEVEAKPPSNIKSLPYGRFRTRTKLVNQGSECVSCYEIVTDILPKHRS